MKSLVLAEKPSVAREIARVLGCTNKNKSFIEGPNYVVTWALGHLVGLAEPEDYDPKYRTWNLDDLPIMPDRMTLKPLKETSGQFKAVLQLCKRADIQELIIATDAGREGELVARWIMELAHWRKPFKRLWISSQTDKAIKDGFASLKPGRDYDRLYASAVCRAEADWLIGLNVTRALTSKYNAQLSAGRVQTPTLAMMMEREREINGFQPKPYWTVSADFGGFQANWRSEEGHDGKLWTRAEAEAVIARTNGKPAAVERLQTKERSEPHPLAYDLTELQRDANKRLGFSAKQTSNVLQRLYEQHKLVTYPRTDSRYLSSDMAPTLKGRLESVAVGPFAAHARKLLRSPLAVTKRIVDDSKVSDHHAIIPTEQYVNLSALTPEERKLHELIVRRFLALFGPPCRYDETNVVIRVGDDRFYVRGNVLKDAGWKEAYGSVQAADLSDEDDDGSADGTDSGNGNGSGSRAQGGASSQLLPPLASGQKLSSKQSRLRELQTQPPARYTEAGLLSKMEKYGLGTPATRADIIEKLLSSQTIDRQGSRLVPTGKGKQLIELAAKELRNPELTADWERELERIAKGQGDAKRFMAGIREKASAWVNEVKQETKEYKPHNLSHARCPDCGKPMVEVSGKRGKTLVCQDRECGYRRAAEPALSNKRCPQCRKKMEIHTGKAGKYAQCRRCNVIEMLEDKAGGGGRVNKHQQKKLVEQYSDKVTLSGGLADALRAALEGNGGEKN